MKVLYITPSLRTGGAERAATILLPGLRQHGIDSAVLALDSGGPFVSPLSAAGIPVEVLNMRHRLDIGPLRSSHLVREFRPTAIISRGVSGAYVGHALARWRHAAHIYNDHRGVGVDLSRRRSWMLGLLARRLSAVIVVCDEQRGGWINYGTPRERVVVIANGVSASEARDARAEVRRELGIRDQAVVAVIVASLRPVKRVPDFVRAVLKARERVTELVGVIAGDGPGRAEVLRAAAGDMAIRFLGHRDDIPRLLQGADLLVLTSAHEALPMAVLEGMAAGLPVLATKVGGIQTLVRDGETGLLVPPADTRSLADGLVRLSRDAALRTKMGRAGRRYSLENWSAKKMIDSYAAVLHAIAATGR